MAPCRFFARGNCLYGASCRNSHDVPVPASAASPSSPSKFRQSGVQEGLQPAPTEYLSSLKASCWFFTQGTCKSGPSCKNIHDVSPASNSEPRSSSQKPAPITSLPTDSGADSQKNGQSEEFLSSERTLKPDAPSFTPRLDVPVVTQAEQTQKPAPCKFFTRGFCRSGAYCRYLHIPLAPNESIQSQEEKEPEQLVSAAKELHRNILLIVIGYH
jgi:CCCH-type zinc finger/Zinc finger C-x8-C-x5-C-x3-H type (and similar)/RNA-binding, Nab2-type zinc finger